MFIYVTARSSGGDTRHSRVLHDTASGAKGAQLLEKGMDARVELGRSRRHRKVLAASRLQQHACESRFVSTHFCHLSSAFESTCQRRIFRRIVKRMAKWTK